MTNLSARADVAASAQASGESEICDFHFRFHLCSAGLWFLNWLELHAQVSLEDLVPVQRVD